MWLSRVLCGTRSPDLKQQMNFLCHSVPAEFTFYPLILKAPFSLPSLCCRDGDRGIAWELLGLCGTVGGAFGKLSQAFIFSLVNTPKFLIMNGDGIFSCNLKAEGVGEDCPGAELAMSCRTPACVKGREQSPGQAARNGAMGKQKHVSPGFADLWWWSQSWDSLEILSSCFPCPPSGSNKPQGSVWSLIPRASRT